MTGLSFDRDRGGWHTHWKTNQGAPSSIATIWSPKVLLCAGPWSARVKVYVGSYEGPVSLLREVLRPTRVPSMLVRCPSELRATICGVSHEATPDSHEGVGECLFLVHRSPSTGVWVDPEVYPRPDGNVFFCAAIADPEAPPDLDGPAFHENCSFPSVVPDCVPSGAQRR